MSALTVRVCLFLLIAIVSCWTVIAQDPGAPSAGGSETAAEGEPPERQPDSSPAATEAEPQETQKVDQPDGLSTPEVDPVDLQQAEAQIIKATNQFRQKHGLEPLERQQQLQQAAEKFAQFMSRKDLYGHHADGRTPAERAQAAGYEYCMVRENIAYRTDTRDNSASGLSETFFSGWKKSPEHRQNMLAEHVTDTAVAIATGDGTTFYAVQMFGRPRSASIEVRVRNRSEAVAHLKVESDYGVDSFELPPNTIATFTRCLPTTLTLKDSQSQVNANEAASFAIVTAEKNDQLQFERLQDAEPARTGRQGRSPGGSPSPAQRAGEVPEP